MSYRPLAFADLTDDELVATYNLASVKKFSEGTIVADGEAQQNCCYVVINGSIRLVSSKRSAKTLTVLGRGEWCGRLGPKETLPYTIIADQPATLMQFSPAAVAQLSGKVQAAIGVAVSNSMLSVCRVLANEAANTAGKLEGLQKSTHEVVENRIAQTKMFIGPYLSDIPKLPPYATELTIQLMSARTTPQEVAESVKRDPSLAALVLQTVNSPYYGLRTKILDYHRACLLLGFNNIHRLVLDRSLQGIMPDTEEFRAIQQHSYIVSVFAQQIAILSGKVAGPTAATIGLLHDLGKSALLLLRQRYPKLATSFAMLDASAIGSSLLASWDLPPAIVRVIELQSWSSYASPEPLPTEEASSISVLHLAHACGDLLIGNDNVRESVFTSEYLEALGFPCSLNDFYKEKVYPSVLKEQKVLPEPIQKILLAPTVDAEEEPSVL